MGIVREAAGLAAYHVGEWSDAIAELRAARRLRRADEAYLPILADCERGLGRPERALDIVRSPEAARLDQAERIELRIVESGARRDLGQYDSAVVALQVPELKDRRLRPWSARLFYAYADALVDAGRDDDGREWFLRAAAADRDGETDAAERLAELEGLEIIDTEEELEGPRETIGGAVEAIAPGRAEPSAQPSAGSATDGAAQEPDEGEDLAAFPGPMPMKPDLSAAPPGGEVEPAGPAAEAERPAVVAPVFEAPVFSMDEERSDTGMDGRAAGASEEEDRPER